MAPMDDVTDTVFRQIVTGLAPPDLYFTEFVNVDGLQSPGRERLMHKLLLDKSEKNVIAQLWGLKPENFYKTTKEVLRMGYAGVDLNMGCPVKTVTKNGACAALINNRELAGQIIDATREAADSASVGQAATDFSVSVKTRLGFTAVDLSWIEFLLGKKLNMLSIHGRTAKQMSKVPAGWELIGRAREMRDSLSPATLIAGNGDIQSRVQGLELANKYKLDAIMVGRGIFHDPFLFAKKSSWENFSKQQKLSLYKKHVQLFAKTWKNGERRIETLNKFCKMYINDFEGASELRVKFMTVNSPEKAFELLAKQQQ